MKRKIAFLLAAVIAAASLPGTAQSAYAAEAADMPSEVLSEESGDDYFEAEPLDPGDDALPWYVQDGNPNPETVSVEEMNRYMEDGTWEERVAFMESLYAEQQELAQELAGIVPEEGDEEALSSEEAAYLAEPVTGISHVMPSEGDVKTLFFTVDFEDYRFKDAYLEKVQEVVFGEDKGEESRKNPAYPYESLTAFYQRSSAESEKPLNISGEVLHFHSVEDRAYYDEPDSKNALLNHEITDWLINKLLEENGSAGNDDSEEKPEKEILNDYMKKFDSDGDFLVDGAYMLYAGPD
ncbi:MAG: hypothetical protein IJU50_01420, partial [Lachnospiraceae bacterium]|nr:hypothetical protein [Lachnospiraceae bacterium]